MIETQPRQKLEKRIDYVGHEKSIIIFGPRQAGKTTLTKAVATNLGEDVEYFNGDDPVTKTTWKTDNIEGLKPRSCLS